MTTLAILFFALILDRVAGDPDWMWAWLRHPVVLFGNAIGWAEGYFNTSVRRPEEKVKIGFAVIAALVIASIFVGTVLEGLFGALGWFGVLCEIVVVAVFLAQKSLADHVLAVANGLRIDGLAGGRAAVAHIVGRNPETLDQTGVVRAAIESLAENLSDGVVAPAFWFVIFGLPGLLAYKMINTADSMIGHLNDRYRDFGRASAKLDDLANWLPARLTVLFIVIACLVHHGRSRALDTISVVLDDGALHRSPNAGWPESAFAGTMNIALGGPRCYAGDLADEPFMNAAGRDVLRSLDIDRAVGLFWTSLAVATVLVGVLVIVT